MGPHASAPAGWGVPQRHTGTPPQRQTPGAPTPTVARAFFLGWVVGVSPGSRHQDGLLRPCTCQGQLSMPDPEILGGTRLQAIFRAVLRAWPAQECPRGALLAHCLPCWACEHRIQMPPPWVWPSPLLQPGLGSLQAQPTPPSWGPWSPRLRCSPGPRLPHPLGRAPESPPPPSLRVGRASPGSSGCLWSHLRSVCPATAAAGARVQSGARNTQPAVVAAQTPQCPHPCTPRAATAAPLGTRTSASDCMLTGTLGPGVWEDQVSAGPARPPSPPSPL